MLVCRRVSTKCDEGWKFGSFYSYYGSRSRSLARGDALFRKLTMCGDDMTNAASSLHLFLPLLPRATAVVVSERRARSMHQKSDRSGISLLCPNEAFTYDVSKVV